jgi:hypothetical protein
VYYWRHHKSNQTLSFVDGRPLTSLYCIFVLWKVISSTIERIMARCSTGRVCHLFPYLQRSDSFHILLCTLSSGLSHLNCIRPPLCVRAHSQCRSLCELTQISVASALWKCNQVNFRLLKLLNIIYIRKFTILRHAADRICIGRGLRSTHRTPVWHQSTPQCPVNGQTILRSRDHFKVVEYHLLGCNAG